jgi:hypothetical protein
VNRLESPLDQLEYGELHTLDVIPFVRAGGCTLYGTPSCIKCPLYCVIPLLGLPECDPPDACPACTERTRCPCGSDKYRRLLLAKRADDTTQSSSLGEIVCAGPSMSTV